MINEIAAVCFVVAAIALIVSVIRDARSDARRIEENDKIRADFEEAMRTGNDYPWRKK